MSDRPRLRVAAAVLIGIVAAAIAVPSAQTVYYYSYSTLAGVSPQSPFLEADSLAVFGAAVTPGGTPRPIVEIYDSGHAVVWSSDEFGTVSRFAGVYNAPGTANGLTDATSNAADAQFEPGNGIAIGFNGYTAIAETSTHRIRVVESFTPPPGAGGGAGQLNVSGYADGSAAMALFQSPRGIALGAVGNAGVPIYVTDGSNVRVLNSGTVSTIAGVADTTGNVDGTGSGARFGVAGWLAAGADGSVYIADTGNNSIRHMTTAGVVTTVTTGTSGPLTVDSSGTIYVGTNCTIVRVAADGTRTTLAGVAGDCGLTDGTGTAARLNVDPAGQSIGIDSSGNLLFLQPVSQMSDSGSTTGGVTFAALRKVAPNGTVSTVVSVNPLGGPDSFGSGTRLNRPRGLAVDPLASGSVVVADAAALREVSSGGTITPLPSTGTDQVMAVAFDSAGTRYATIGCGIEKRTPGGSTTVFGSLSSASGCGSADGAANVAQFGKNPEGIAVAPDGTVYVADTSNYTIRKIAADGTVSTLAGVAGSSGFIVGPGGAARFFAPSGIAVNSAGTIYVTDRRADVVEQVTPSGTVSLLAGSEPSLGCPGLQDGAGLSAKFCEPHGIAVDSGDVLWVADSANNAVRRVTANGVVTTMGGTRVLGTADSASTTATFSFPWGIAVGPDAKLYVSDQGNYAIRVGSPAPATAPTITSQPADAIEGDQPAQFSVTATGAPAPAYIWHYSLDGGTTWTDWYTFWQDVQSETSTLNATGLRYNGTTLVSSYLVRCVVSNIAGSVTSAPARLTLATLNSDRPVLFFGGKAATTGGPITSVTPAQVVTIGYIGPRVPTWTAMTATADQPWVQVTASATGTVSIVVADPTNALAGRTSERAFVTVSAPGLSSALVEVELTIYQHDSPPFGYFDTPVNNATGLTGSIAVTGWALDYVHVDRVEIWRNCVEAIDRPEGVCTIPAPGTPANSVYLGKATFVSGARPDVAARYSFTVPAPYDAGWGYLLLTNKLPHVPNGLPEGGEGTFTLSAWAINSQNQYTLLGTKTIGVDNDHATQPFGAIDTPDQGGTVPGTTAPYNTSTAYPNFGWAMTQAAKCIDVTSTASYQVIIDGVSRPLTAGSNWFAGATRSDLEAAFPGLCNTTNALALYHIDVGALGLANGLHTIIWNVTDNAGNTGSIGSRYFNVQVPTGGQQMLGAARLVRGAGQQVLGPGLLARGAGRTDMLESHSASMSNLIASVNRAASVIVTPDANSVSHVRMPALGRLILDLGAPVQGGFAVVGDQLRPLPVGSTLDAANGRFYWQPGVGFLGPFHLVFVSGTRRTDVEVTIVDSTASNDVLLQVDTPQETATVSGAFTIAGWALDPLAVSGSGIGAVHVWAYRRDVPNAAPQFLGAAAVNGARADVAQVYGAQFDHAAWSLDAPALGPGTYDLVVYAWSDRTQTWAATRIVRIPIR